MGWNKTCFAGYWVMWGCVCFCCFETGVTKMLKSNLRWGWLSTCWSAFPNWDLGATLNSSWHVLDIKIVFLACWKLRCSLQLTCLCEQNQWFFFSSVLVCGEETRIYQYFSQDLKASKKVRGLEMKCSDWKCWMWKQGCAVYSRIFSLPKDTYAYKTRCPCSIWLEFVMAFECPFQS